MAMIEPAAASNGVSRAAGSGPNSARRATLWAVAGLAMLVITGAIVVGVRQYRAVIGPLRRLGAGVHRVAGGNFDAKLEAFGDKEFAELGQDFDAMAGQIGLLYRDLEAQVALKSKELTRSQRLASVGYLAAGVAHEINNPLAIIGGYGERSLQLLDRAQGDGPARGAVSAEGPPRTPARAGRSQGPKGASASAGGG